MKEALKLALEALQAHGTAYLHHELRYEEALTAIKEALAQPESNPWREAVEDELVTAHILNDSHSDPRKAVKDAIDWHVQVALDPQVSSDAAALIDRGMKQERALWQLSKLGQEIEAQPEQEPLLLNGLTEAETNSSASVMGLTKHIQPEQEPVAFPNRRAVEREIERIQNPKGMHLNDGKERVILPGGTLRYLLALADRATSPQRPWVGLTEVDILAASRHWRHAEDFMAGVYWAAGTLKEFNT